MAAAQEIPIGSEIGDEPTIRTVAQQYAASNGYDDPDDTLCANPNQKLSDPEVCVFWPPATGPFAGNAAYVEVTIKSESGGMFAGIWDILSPDHGARATGRRVEAEGGPGDYLFFQGTSDCNASLDLELSGSNNDFTGNVHSNAGLKLNGSNNDFEGEITYRSSCGVDQSGSNLSFDPEPPEGYTPNSALPLPMPIGDGGDGYEYDDFPCHNTHNPAAGLYRYTNSSLDIKDKSELWLNNNPNTKQLKPNIMICVAGELKISTQGVSGTATFVAQTKLDMSGSDPSLTGSFNNILFYAGGNSDDAIKIAGSGDSDPSTAELTGFIHAPRGRVKWEGSNSYSAFISVIAWRIQVPGSNSNLAALNEASGADIEPALELVE
jgi:hypothetical protein